MVCLLCDFKILLTGFNQSYNCQTSHYLGRNQLPKPCLILPSMDQKISDLFQYNMEKRIEHPNNLALLDVNRTNFEEHCTSFRRQKMLSNSFYVASCNSEPRNGGYLMWHNIMKSFLKKQYHFFIQLHFINYLGLFIICTV